MTNTDEVRTAFERCVRKMPLPNIEAQLERAPNGDYTQYVAVNGWHFFQAAAALYKLPEEDEAVEVMADEVWKSYHQQKAQVGNVDGKILAQAAYWALKSLMKGE